MKFLASLILIALSFSPLAQAIAKDLPKIAVWSLAPRNTPPTHAQELTSILVSEISKLKRYEVYSQENVQTLSGWTAERMKLGCTDTQCLLALGQMEIAKLISGSVGKIGNRYTVSLNLFDTQNARSENSVSKFCTSEDELIELVQQTVRELLGAPAEPSVVVEERVPAKKTLEKTFTNFIGMEFVLVPAGKFKMGSPAGEFDRLKDEGPQHDVEITKPFYLGKYEVKVLEFRQFVRETGYKTDAETKGGAWGWKGAKWEKLEGVFWDKPGFKQTDLHPVTCVSWNDATEFCKWLSRKTGHSYRLPTEAEYEYACRAGTKTSRYWGFAENEACMFANVADRRTRDQYPHLGAHDCTDDYVHTAPVGNYRPNAFGLYDLLGNVWEWCLDWYDKDYYLSSASSDPRGPDKGSRRVLRGGSWTHGPRVVRCAKRGGQMPFYCGIDLGMRIVRTAP